MSAGDFLVENVPDELFAWLQAEALRCGQDVGELVIAILETHRFWNEPHDNKNKATQSHRERDECRLAKSEPISEVIKRAFGG
jgi:hypothetical protein